MRFYGFERGGQAINIFSGLGEKFSAGATAEKKSAAPGEMNFKVIA